MNKFIALTILMAASTNIQASSLGRLFYSVSERDQLERQHVLSVDDASTDSRSIIVNGVIQRDGGKRVIWVNGRQESAGNADAHSPTSVPVVLPGKTAPVKVKVGQRLLIDQIDTEEK